jgi:hypothetical protein
MKTGYRAREAAARLRETRYETSDEVRAARSVMLKHFDLRRRLSAADQRVEAARKSLQCVDVAALETELAAALAEQTAIADELSTMQEPSEPARVEKFKAGRKPVAAEEVTP